MKFDKPPFLSGNFSKILVAVIPTVVAQRAPNIAVPIIIAGSLLPAAARRGFRWERSPPRRSWPGGSPGGRLPAWGSAGFRAS